MRMLVSYNRLFILNQHYREVKTQTEESEETLTVSTFTQQSLHFLLWPDKQSRPNVTLFIASRNVSKRVCFFLLVTIKSRKLQIYSE